jgi:hypothetical protein
VPKVCPTRAHLRAFWITLDYDDRLKPTFDGKILRALPRIMFCIPAHSGSLLITPEHDSVTEGARATPASLGLSL